MDNPLSPKASARTLGDPVALALQSVELWNSHGIEPHHLCTEVVRGGLTNVLTRVYVVDAVHERLPEHVPREVLLRQFGLGTEDLIDRAREAVVFRTLGENGVGPKLYGVFDGGRAEQFLHGETFITAEFHIPEYSEKIAEQVARFHATEPAIERANLYNAGFEKWWRLAATAVMPTKEKALKARQFDLALLHSEMCWLLQLLSEAGSPIVFTHNDLLAGNVMRLGDGRVVLVDFEYGAYSYRGHDFGNHFAESMIHYNVSRYPGFYINPDGYPSDAIQSRFFHAYLTASGLTSEAEREAMLPQLKEEAKKFALASHLQWGLWGIVQAARSSIDFGFLEFSAARFDQYFAQKREWGFKLLGE